MSREMALFACVLPSSPDEHGVNVLMVLMFRYPSTDSVERIRRKVERTLYQSLKTRQLLFTISRPSLKLTRKPLIFICHFLVSSSVSPLFSIIIRQKYSPIRRIHH